MDGLVVLKCDQQEWIFEEFEWTEFASRRRSETWIGGFSVNDDRADSGLFISCDPTGHRGNLDLYAYATNPVTFVDPSGLDIAIIVSGPVETNPFGPVAIAVEGGGVYSFDTGTPFGSDFGPYLDSQVERRYLEVLVLETTNEAVAATTRRLTRDRGAYEIYLRHGREIPKARKELLRKFKEFKGPPCP